MGPSSSNMSSVAEILNGLKSQINKEMVKKTKTIFVFEIDGKHWTLNLKTGDGSLEEGKPKKADCTLIMTEAVFMDMFTGKMNPQTGFMQGKSCPLVDSGRFPTPVSAVSANQRQEYHSGLS